MGTEEHQVAVDCRFFFQAEDGIRDLTVTGVQTCALPISEFDPLRDEGAAYAERLRAAGVKITYRCHPGMIHLFYGLGALIPYAGAAFGLMGEIGRASCRERV